MKVFMGIFMIITGIFLSGYIENDMGILIVSLWLIAGMFLLGMPNRVSNKDKEERK